MIHTFISFSFVNKLDQMTWVERIINFRTKLFTSRCRVSNAELTSEAGTEATNMKPFSFSTDFNSSTMSIKLDRRKCALRDGMGSSEAPTFPRDSNNERNRTILIFENMSNTFHAASSVRDRWNFILTFCHKI